jgi:hypothetical protein
MNLPETFPNLRSASDHLMKLILTLALACAALLWGGCADQSLLTDEEYANSRRPAPNSPDPTAFLPRSTAGRY